jgi:hypothetical protein
MAGRTVSGERLRITRLLDQALTSEVERQLEALLEADEGMYRISILKHEPKDFSYGELRQEVERGKFFQPLFAFGQTFLALAGLSNENVKYYASLVQFYTVYKLQRMAVPTVRLYLLCFASHRFRQINDNLIEAFIHLVDDYEQQAKIAAEIAAAESMAEATGNLQAAGQVLNLFLDPSIADLTPFSKVRQQAFSLLDAERFAQVSGYMRKIEFDKTSFEWSFYSTLHAKFKLNLRHLFSNLDFAGLVEDVPLLEAVAFLQEILRHGRSPRQMSAADLPTGIIAKNVQRYMYTEAAKRRDRQLDIDRYEFLIYRLLRKALEAGNVQFATATSFAASKMISFVLNAGRTRMLSCARSARRSFWHPSRRRSPPSMRNLKRSSSASIGGSRMATTSTSRSPGAATTGAGRWSIPPMKNPSTALSTASYQASASPTCCGSSPKSQNSSMPSLMFWAVM